MDMQMENREESRNVSSMEVAMKTEEYLIKNPIVYYAKKTGTLSETQNELIITLKDGLIKKTYTYNLQNNTFKRDDVSGTKYYSKNDEETEREKRFLIYELKKLYLNSQQEQNVKNLREGKFNYDILLAENIHSQSNFLKKSTKYFHFAIDIMSDANQDHDGSLMEQFDNLMSFLLELKSLSSEIGVNEFEGSMNFIIEFFQNLSRTDNATNKKNCETKEYKFIFETLNLIKSKVFKPEQLKLLKDSTEYIDVIHASTETCFGNLIKDMKLQVLVYRKNQIEKELDKTKLIDEKIRKNKHEIWKIRGDLSENFKIVNEDEERFKRLYKAQKMMSNQEYRDGLTKTKEKAERDKLKLAIRHSKFDNDSEKKDFEEVKKLIDKELLRTGPMKDYLAKKMQKIENFKTVVIPTLLNKLDLFPIVEGNLKEKSSEIKKELDKMKTLAGEEQIKINDLEKNNAYDEENIKAQYGILSKILEEIESLKKDIQTWNKQKKAVREEEESAFKDKIFDQVGGQRADNYSPDGYFNHKNCPATLLHEKMCQYKNAVKDAVSFSISKFPNLALKDDLLNHLSGYEHSAVKQAKHQADLLMIPKHVFDSYTDVQNRIAQRENDLQHLINKRSSEQESKINQRNNLRKDIIEKENVLNERHLELNESNRRFFFLDFQENYEIFFSDLSEKNNEQQESTIGQLIYYEEKIQETRDNIVDKREDILDLMKEINFEGDYNKLLALSETRWRCSQYSRIISNIGFLQKQNTEQKNLDAEKKSIQISIEENISKKKLLDFEREKIKDAINRVSLAVEILTTELNDFSTSITNLEKKKSTGLVNVIQTYQKNRNFLEKKHITKIKAINRDRTEIVKRKVYKTLDFYLKGTCKSDNYFDDIGTTSHLYKKRGHRNCQDVFDKESQACKYFDALDIILKLALETDPKNDSNILIEFKSKHSHFENHVLVRHNEDIDMACCIIKSEIKKFNETVKGMMDTHSKDLNAISKLIIVTSEQLAEKKKFDEIINVKNLIDRSEEKNKQNIQECLEAGIDIVIIDQKEIYTSIDTKMTIDEFVKKLLSHSKNPLIDIEHARSELVKLLASRGAVSLDAILSQKQTSNRKNIYELVVNYFDKTFLKKKLELESIFNEKFIAESKIRGIDIDIEKMENEIRELSNMVLETEKKQKLNKIEIERLIQEEIILQKSNEINEIKDFEEIKKMYEYLLVELKADNKKDEDYIQKQSSHIQELKKKKSGVINDESAKIIESRLLLNPFKIGLKKNKQHHRNCGNECDFFQNLQKLIKDFLNDLRSNVIKVRSPDFKVSDSVQIMLLSKLNLKGQHSQIHEKSFKRIIGYIAEEYGQEREQIILNEQNEIAKMEWKNAKANAQKDAINTILIADFSERIAEVDKLLTIWNQSSFINSNLIESEVSQELREYKQEKFEASFERQIDYLVKIFQKVEVYLKNKENQNHTTITNCICEVLEEYFSDLKNDDNLISQLIATLEYEKNDKNLHESKFRVLIRKKTATMGGLDYIIKKISWIFQEHNQNYDESIDPDKLYMQILKEEDVQREKKKEESLEKLHQELIVLEASRKNLFVRDNSLLREELKSIVKCLRYIENKSEVVILQNRIENIDEIKSNRDDYYSFDLDKKRVCVRLIQTNPIEKSAEVRKIDRIRSYIMEKNEKLLELKVKSEQYSKQVEEDRAEAFKSSFKMIQRHLFLKGVSLCGYDVFENGEPLDEFSNIVSVIISTLICVNNLYQIEGLNSVSKQVEVWIRKFVLNHANHSIDVENIIKLVNNEFISDNLCISKIIIISDKNKQEKFSSYIQSVDLSMKNTIITLLKHENKYFSLIPQENVIFYKNDIRIDSSMKIAYIFSVLQSEDDLLKYFCVKRLKEILGVNLEISKKLGDVYRKEKKNLAKIYSLTDFNAQFCHILDVSETSKSSFLFAYLASLENIELNIDSDIAEGKTERLKIMKNLYDTGLLNLLKEEQQRRKRISLLQLQESSEELYFKELIKDKEGEIALLLQDIKNFEENIEKDQELMSQLLLEKEDSNVKFRQKVEQLSNVSVHLKKKLHAAQDKLRELNKEAHRNQQQIQKIQDDILIIEADLKRIEEEIILKEREREAIDFEIKHLDQKNQKLNIDLNRTNEEKKRKEQERLEKQMEIDVNNDIIIFIKNLKSVLASSEIQAKMRVIIKVFYSNKTLLKLLTELEKELVKLTVNSSVNFWQLVIKDINYENLTQFIRRGKKLAGMLPHELVKRLKSIVKDSASFESELSQELVKGNIIKKFKISTTNLSYSNLHKTIKDEVEKQFSDLESTKGLSFKKKILHSSDYGVTSIKDLPHKLSDLINKKIELNYRSEEIETKKLSKFRDASKIINELKIDYKDVIRCYVDQIEIIASGKFILDDAPSFSGIDLAINAVDMECVGENLTIDTSGKNGENFRHKASDGDKKRNSDNKPRGDRGYDGYDGEHGDHAGNIIINIENEIVNFKALRTVKANGGKGGEGQLGGNGDEGYKGSDGENGRADDTREFGGGQTTIGFGRPGLPGGRGGSPGKSGRSGNGGKAGVIDIQHEQRKIDLGEMKQGFDADDILNKSKPSGGLGGEPGLYGIDQIQEKQNFFTKTKTFTTVIDRAALIQKYPEIRDEVAAAENVSGQIIKLADSWLALKMIVPFYFPFGGEELSYKESKDNTLEYRNRDQHLTNRRGMNNEVDAQLRNDFRLPQEQKLDMVKIDSLKSRLNHKKQEENEVSGEAQYKEISLYLEVEKEEVINDIDRLVQETSTIKSDLENLTLEQETKAIELEKILTDLSSLRSEESTVNSERIGKISKIIKSIVTSQNLRDQRGEVNLDISQTLAKLKLHVALADKFSENKADLIRIIDEYIIAIRERLKRNRSDLKYLKSNLTSKKSEVKNLSSKLEDLQRERLSQITADTELEIDIEAEVEFQHVEEIRREIDWEDDNMYKKLSEKTKDMNEEPYVTTKYIYDFKNIENSSKLKLMLDQSVRHYRAQTFDDEKVKLIFGSLGSKTFQSNLNETDFTNCVKVFKKTIKNVRISRCFETLKAIDRSLLIDNLKQISSRLTADVCEFTISNDDKVRNKFVLRTLKFLQSDEKHLEPVTKKLQDKIDGLNMFINDELKDEIDSLIEIFEDKKLFLLELSAINITKTSLLQAMIKYNKQPNLERLKSVVTEFKTHQEELLNDNRNTNFITKEYMKSVIGFFSIMVENLRHHGTMTISFIKAIRKSKLSLSNDFKTLEHIFNDLNLINNNMRDEGSTRNSFVLTIEKIRKVLKLFDKIIKNVRKNISTFKNLKRVETNLEMVTTKLIKYVNFNNDILQTASLTLESEKLEEINEDKIESLVGLIEDIEDKVISKSEIIEETVTNEERDENREIGEILKEWAFKLRKKYDIDGELDENEAQSMILSVLEKNHLNGSKKSLSQEVNNEFTIYFKTLDDPVRKKEFLEKALNHQGGTVELADSNAIVEIESLMQLLNFDDETKKKITSLSERDKTNLFTYYKREEFLCLQKLIYKTPDKISKIIDEGIEFHKDKDPKEQYITICYEKITSIKNELSILENRCSVNNISYLVAAIVEGLEHFSNKNNHRHKFYDKVLQLFQPFLLTTSCTNDISFLELQLKDVHQNILIDQWKKFVEEQKYDFTPDKHISEDLIMSILQKLCNTENDDMKVEEFQYHIDWFIEYGKLNSQNLYTLIDYLNDILNLEISSEMKRVKINSLENFMFNVADKLELGRITEFFESKLQYQKSQYNIVNDAKLNIISEIGKCCRSLDRKNKENYIKIVNIHLNKIYILVSELNAGDISFSKRLEVFNKLRKAIHAIFSKTIGDEEKAIYIENEISTTINKLVFSSSNVVLSVDIMSHFEQSPESFSKNKSDFKRKNKTINSIKIENLFDNNGRIKPAQGEEVFLQNKTVVISFEQNQEFYRLSEDLNSLRGNKSTYQITIQNYSKELTNQYKKYKLAFFRHSIETFNSNKSLKTFLNIAQSLIYYLSLHEDHLITDEKFECSLNSFLKSFHEIVKSIMINDKDDQDFISELRLALNIFKMDFIEKRKELRSIDCLHDTEETLKSLCNSLIFKTYKRNGFDLFYEEENHIFEHQNASDSELKNFFKQLVQEEIPDLLWQRSMIPVKLSGAFIKSLFESVTKNFPEKLSINKDESFQNIRKFLNTEKAKILFEGLVDDNASIKNFDEFLIKIKTKELTWNAILSYKITSEQKKLQKLCFIVQEYHFKFDKEILEELIITLAEKENNTEIKSLLSHSLRCYAKNILEDKKNSRSILKVAIENAFHVWNSDQNSQQHEKVKVFLVYLKSLDDYTLSESPEETSKSLEKEYVKFLAGILSVTLKNITNDVFVQFEHQNTFEKRITYLQMMLQLPDNIFIEEKSYNLFIQKSAKQTSENSSDQAVEKLELYSFYVREHIVRYYGLFLDQILRYSEEIDRKKSDFQEALRRLYENTSVSNFVDHSLKYLKLDGKHEKYDNFVVCHQKNHEKIGENDLKSILQFLNNNEKEHVQALLTLIKSKKIQDIQQTKQKLSLDEEIIKLNHLESRNTPTNIQIKIKNIFVGNNRSHIMMWEEDLIALRMETVRDVIFSKKANQQHDPAPLDEILHVFRHFHDCKGKLNEALKTLDLICENISKFPTLEELKQFIFSISHMDDLTTVDHIIKTNNRQNITLNFLFSQIGVSSNSKINNSLTKLKIVLSHRKFAEINYFCRIFSMQLHEQQDTEVLPELIDMILESKAYINQDFLMDIANKELSSWRSLLFKKITLNKLNATLLQQCRDKEKLKIVELLYQIREDKGKTLFEIILEKIKKLDKTIENFRHTRKLKLILSKIIHEPYSGKLTELSSKLYEWEESLYPNIIFKEGKTLTIVELLNVMRKDDKILQGGINESVNSCLIIMAGKTSIESLLSDARNLNKLSKICDISKTIINWQAQEIKQWSIKFRSSWKDDSIYVWNSDKTSTKTIIEVISVIIRAVIVFDHYPNGPRDTQLIALLLFLDSNNIKGRLANIFTGEGKTLVTVMLATCLSLVGKKVDVITSSKVLAIRDSGLRNKDKDGYREFFEMFDLKANNNCDVECEKAETGESERKKRYESCNIMYGEASYFQRDILLSQFFGKNIRDGSGIADALILDEVDSMMIDNAAKTLYISHNITDMRHLRDVFIHIWAAVNSREESNFSEENVKKIVKFINNLIENDTDIGFQLKIPTTLNDFVQTNLKTWVESAYDAKYIGIDNAYIIGDESSMKQNEVIIMDKDTGVEQTSTRWSNGLHQFIQLKHSGKVSDESLKAVFISNVGYFKKYKNVFGMTGTLGDRKERKLLKDVYGLEFFEIPRFKSNHFEYDFESESVAGILDVWLQNIIDNIDENMHQKLEYSKEYSSLMLEKFEEENKSLQKLQNNLVKLKEKKKKLHQQQMTSEENIDTLHFLEEISKQISTICGKLDVGLFHKELKRIKEEIQKIKNPNPNSDVNGKIIKAVNLIKMTEKVDTEFGIQQFGKDYQNEIRNILLADSINKEKEELERLNGIIPQIQKEIDIITEAETQRQKDVDFYEKESQVETGAFKIDCRRAVLIICDSISDLKRVEDRVRDTFNKPGINNSVTNRIYKYDRAYQKFDISCLEAGDIVIATNIAGRGTNLKVSKQVEENGGLHVILSYMPRNVRIEKQAFGRTARAGKKGSATYIVFDSRKQNENVDVSQLKTERNENEANRLQNVQKEQLPKITLEDELFARFNKFRENLEHYLTNSSLTGQEKKLKDTSRLQIESLKNKWAIWLNKMNDKFNDVHKSGRDAIFKEYELFEHEISRKIDNQYGLIEEPGELNKLGRIHLDNKQYSKASDCFNHIIDNHSSFSSIALYYDAFCIINKEGGGFDAKLKAKTVLKKSLKMLENERSKILSRNQILKTINEVARMKGRGLESNFFAKQNEGEAQILSIHINAINSAIGSEICPDSFNASGIMGDQAKKVYSEFMTDQYDILKDFRISKKCIIASKVIMKDRGQQIKILTDENNNLDSKEVSELINNLNNEYFTCENKKLKGGYESFIQNRKILENKKVISQRQLFKRSKNSFVISEKEQINFPDVYFYCKEQIMDTLSHLLSQSKTNSWHFEKREIKPKLFEPFIYTQNKFLKQTEFLIKVEDVINIATDIHQKLLGKLDHQIFCD